MNKAFPANPNSRTKTGAHCQTSLAAPFVQKHDSTETGGIQAKTIIHCSLVLEIRNTAYSRFNGNRLLKMTVNRSDSLLAPANVPALVSGEYLPAHDGQVEFVLPADFDGKLGFVFYNANLNDLQISAFYK
jgi:hypothetical protein